MSITDLLLIFVFISILISIFINIYLNKNKNVNGEALSKNDLSNVEEKLEKKFASSLGIESPYD